jgi:hypothetical protein
MKFGARATTAQTYVQRTNENRRDQREAKTERSDLQSPQGQKKKNVKTCRVLSGRKRKM